MKLQYLGDSKDSFKWDYHNFLIQALGYKRFKIAWAITPDDNGPDGKSVPELFPARQEILQLCNELRHTRDTGLLFTLPSKTGPHYTVKFHDTDNSKNVGADHSFFSGIATDPDEVIFLTPTTDSNLSAVQATSTSVTRISMNSSAG